METFNLFVIFMSLAGAVAIAAYKVRQDVKATRDAFKKSRNSNL